MMHLRIITLLLFLPLYTYAVLDQNTSDTLNTQTVLYKITHPNLNTESYLFGTHHAFGKHFFDSLLYVNEALESSNLLIKENLNTPGAQAQDIINCRTSTTKWSKYLTKDHLDYINNLFKNSPTNYHKMTPAELSAFLNRYYKQKYCINKENISLTLDDYIGSLAEILDIKCIGLETTAEQIFLINKDIEGMPKKVHKKRLSNLITKIKKGNSDDCAETNWYSSMDFDFKLKQACNNTLLLENRNDKWMVQIQQYLQTNNCFIAIGLSHLMYRCGLIHQLQTLGYTITPIPVK